MSGVRSSARRPSHTKTITRRAAEPAPCCWARRLGSVARSVPARAYGKMRGRIFMVRLLGIGAKGDDCPIQVRTVRRLESAKENIDFKLLSEAMSARALASNT